MIEEKSKKGGSKNKIKVVDTMDILAGGAITVSGLVFLLLVVVLGSNNESVKKIRNVGSKIIKPPINIDIK
ncbi:MAG: hypothetical protein J7L51_02625 [Desulfurococcales archaeon]|nr:hypothetical protein [Desulfurococcales archaeon]